MRKERRLRFFVNEFQGKLLWRFVTYWLIYQFTMWNIMFFWQVLSEGKGNVLEQYARFVASQYPMLLCLIVLIPFFAWDAIKFSLRVAGPLYRIRATIQAIESGRSLRPVTMRDGDYLQEVIDDLNSLIAFLGERKIASVDPSASSSRKGVAANAHSAGSADPQEVAEPEAMAHSV
jgi:hypothetical protein